MSVRYWATPAPRFKGWGWAPRTWVHLWSDAGALLGNACPFFRVRGWVCPIWVHLWSDAGAPPGNACPDSAAPAQGARPVSAAPTISTARRDPRMWRAETRTTFQPAAL